MKISTNSWHTRLYKTFYNNNLPKDLCSYFWKVVLATVSVVSGIILILSTLAGMVIIWFNPKHILSNLGGVGYIILFMVIVWYLADLVQYVYRKIKGPEKPYKHWEKKEKKPNIFVKYLKAFKDKNCPIIEWKDNTKVSE